MDAKSIHVSALGTGTSGSNQKERFHVKLTPGQTNIISLKKLRREAGEVVSDDSSDENEAIILREMILEDLFSSNAKGINFKQIKTDLVKMIRLEAPSLNVKVFPASEITIGKTSMGDQLEDKLYDVYDAFSQGLDKDIGPSLVRRLYAKLAELWPKDTMDRDEIREAICRAKERRMVHDRE